MAFESINLSPNSEENRSEPKVRVSAQDFAKLEKKLAIDHSHINKIADRLNAKEKTFAYSVKRAEGAISAIKEVTEDTGKDETSDIELSSSELRRFKYAELDGNMVKERGEKRVSKKMGGEIRSRWIEDNKRIKNLTEKIESYVASNHRDQKTISALRSELLTAETLLNTHRTTIKELRSDKNIPKDLKDEADHYAKEDAKQINKLTGVLNKSESVKNKMKKNFVLDEEDAFRDKQNRIADQKNEEVLEYQRKKKVRESLPQIVSSIAPQKETAPLVEGRPTDESPDEPRESETPRTSVEEEVEVESKSNLSQIKNKIASIGLRFSRAQTALYSKKSSDGYKEFKEDLSNVLESLSVVANDIADLEFQKEEFIVNKNGTSETPEQKSKRNKRNEEGGKKFDNEKTALNEKVNILTVEINKIIGGGKSLEDIIKDIGVSNADKLIKISEKAKLTKVEADKVLNEIKEALKKKSTDKGFSNLEKEELINKLSSLTADTTDHKVSLGKISPSTGNAVEAARYGVATDVINSIASTLNKAEEMLEKKNEKSDDERFEKYQKALKEERLKMIAKKLEIQKLDLDYKASVESEKLANKKEKLSILAEVEAEKRLAKAEKRKPDLKGIDTAALKVLRPLRRFFQFKHKAYKLNREGLCHEARGVMDEVTYNYHRLTEFEGVELNQENSVNFNKTFARSTNFKNKTEIQYELDATSDVITEKSKLKNSFKDMIGNMLEDGNGWGAVGAGLVMGLGMGTSAAAGGVKNLFAENPNGSVANSINHPAPQASTRNSGARTAAYIGGGVAAGIAATAFAMSGSAAQAPHTDEAKVFTGPTPTVATVSTEESKPKIASIKEKESTLYFKDQDKNFTLRQMKNSDGSTDIILDMPANYADDNNMAARYEHAKDSLMDAIVINPELKSYRDQIAKNGKLLINTGRETNIVVPMTINISESGEKKETVAEANFENPAMVKMAEEKMKNRFGETYQSYTYNV